MDYWHGTEKNLISLFDTDMGLIFLLHWSNVYVLSELKGKPFPLMVTNSPPLIDPWEGVKEVIVKSTLILFNPEAYPAKPLFGIRTFGKYSPAYKIGSPFACFGNLHL